MRSMFVLLMRTDTPAFEARGADELRACLDDVAGCAAGEWPEVYYRPAVDSDGVEIGSWRLSAGTGGALSLRIEEDVAEIIAELAGNPRLTEDQLARILGILREREGEQGGTAHGGPQSREVWMIPCWAWCERPVGGTFVEVPCDEANVRIFQSSTVEVHREPPPAGGQEVE